jgi:hypothetical protein
LKNSKDFSDERKKQLSDTEYNQKKASGICLKCSLKRHWISQCKLNFKRESFTEQKPRIEYTNVHAIETTDKLFEEKCTLNMKKKQNKKTRTTLLTHQSSPTKPTGKMIRN